MQKKVKTALQKKNGRPKKKKWAEKWARKKAPIFFNGRSQKKKEGQRPFFWDRFLGALLPNKPIIEPKLDLSFDKVVTRFLTVLA